MAATIAALADGLRELEFKVVNNTYEISQAGGAAGVQYTEAATDTTITGTAVMWEDTSDTLRSVSASKPLPVNIISGGSGGTQYAEDAIHVSGDLGTMALAVRKDTASAVAADGDYIPQIVDSTGKLWTHVGAIDAGSAIIGKVGIDQTTAGSTNATQLKQYTGTPSSFTIQTSDQTVFTLAAGEVGFIQNLDDAALAVKKGASGTSVSLSLILPAGTAADDGKGGTIIIDDWVGVVSVAAMTGSPRYIAWKQAP